MYIKRHIEDVIKRVSSGSGLTFPAVIVTGARQVGKSTMFSNTLKGVRQVSLDTLAVREVAIQNPELFFRQYPPPIVVDEVQRAPILFEYIKEKVDNDNEKKAGQFFLTGSQSFGLMKNVSESLAGRASIITMAGLSLREILGLEYYASFRPTQTHCNDIVKLMPKDGVLSLFKEPDITEIIWKGSFPRLHQRESIIMNASLIKIKNGELETHINEKELSLYERHGWRPVSYLKQGDENAGLLPVRYQAKNITVEEWQIYYDAYVRTYIERDVRQLTQIQNEMAFYKFMRGVASLTGEQLNYSDLCRICGKDIKTIKEWLSILITSGLVYLLEPYYNNTYKRMTQSPKLYFMDTGLACFLGGWNTPQQILNGAKWGELFETFVVVEILKSYYNSGKSSFSIPLYYYRDKDNTEIDLIIEDGSTLHPIEIKTTGAPKKTMIKSFGKLNELAVKSGKKVGEGAVICQIDRPLPITETVMAIPPWMI